MRLRLAMLAFGLCRAAIGDEARERELEQRLKALETRVATLEARLEGTAGAGPPAGSPSPVVSPAPPAPAPPAPALPRGIAVSAYFDGNYTWNTNAPYNRTNVLRAYDVLHNNFSINQSGLVIERSVDPNNGRRFGMRLDLMYGQATETLQGNARNEPRPWVFRPVFQAYGTYVLPLGRGLTTDFGKFSSALGYESNYTKDQFNYSRSYLYSFLPFYHMGFRSTYAFTNRLSITHWLVNGAQQTEDFNGFKSNAILLNVAPARRISWSINYYFGREGRQYLYRQGLFEGLVRPTPDGRLHVLDSYASWRVTDRLTVVGETDYVVERVTATAAPSRLIAGAGYAAYRFHPRWSAATRFEYIDDRHGLFSSASQALKENTFTLSWEPQPGFQMRGEFRRDYSDRAFFPTRDPARLRASQNTATIGLIWWIGTKEGTW